MAEDLEAVKNDVWVRLPQLTGEELTLMCAGLKLTLPESKKNTKSALYSLVLQQLMSVDVDEVGEEEERELFTNIKGAIDQVFKIREVKAEKEGRSDQVDDQVSSGSGGGQTPVEGQKKVEQTALENNGGGSTVND